MKLLVLACLAALLGLAAAQPGSAPAAQAPARIGFVDLDEALGGCGKIKADLEELGKNLQAKLNEMKGRAEGLNKQTKELAILDRDSEEYYVRRRDLDAEGLKLDADDKHL